MNILNLSLISNNCNCKRGCFCSFIPGNDTVMQDIIFERPVSIPRQQVTVSNAVSVFKFGATGMPDAYSSASEFCFIIEVEGKRVNCKNQVKIACKSF